MPITATSTARRPVAPAFKPFVGASTKTPGLMVLFTQPGGKGLVVFGGASTKYKTGDSNLGTGRNWKPDNFVPVNEIAWRPVAAAAPVRRADAQPAYPFLASSDTRPGVVVLVYGPGRDSKSFRGTVLQNDNPKRGDHGVGYHSDAWKKSRLSVFRGEVTLRG